MNRTLGNQRPYKLESLRLSGILCSLRGLPVGVPGISRTSPIGISGVPRTFPPSTWSSILSSGCSGDGVLTGLSVWYCTS